MLTHFRAEAPRKFCTAAGTEDHPTLLCPRRTRDEEFPPWQSELQSGHPCAGASMERVQNTTGRAALAHEWLASGSVDPSFGRSAAQPGALRCSAVRAAAKQDRQSPDPFCRAPHGSGHAGERGITCLRRAEFRRGPRYTRAACGC